jgi:hypothetical protein
LIGVLKKVDTEEGHRRREVVGSVSACAQHVDGLHRGSGIGCDCHVALNRRPITSCRVEEMEYVVMVGPSSRENDLVLRDTFRISGK